jgi:hypothetical protein
MANRQRGEFPIQLGGKEFTLRPSFEALEAACSDVNLGLPVLAGTIMSPHWRPSHLLAMVKRTMSAGGEKVPDDLPALLLAQTLTDVADTCEQMLRFALIGSVPKNSEAPRESQTETTPTASLGAVSQE